MKIILVVVLVFLAVINARAEDDPKKPDEENPVPMCPWDFMKKHPELWDEWKEKHKKNEHGTENENGNENGNEHGKKHKHGHHDKHHMNFPNFTAMADCAKNEDCPAGNMCCQTPCGSKCQKAVSSKYHHNYSLYILYIFTPP
ncbi:hypothetical protein GDO86_013512 [Hymenochirus boettgeri]|uniref:WAP domain-containing protein n=1 Tax=Hymenochirus boettgeri TaxID=247094 RepID=A0A8T2IX33_9PIPI|nr:hypothetical protein GDO86_013512 [Hymenochirus boettgeri]